jgi:hypothetical protein
MKDRYLVPLTVLRGIWYDVLAAVCWLLAVFGPGLLVVAWMLGWLR